MTPVSLEELGWTDAQQRAFAALAASGVVPGRVVLEHNHVYRVLTADGEQLAESAGRMKHLAEGRQALPVVGDWVSLRPDPKGGRCQIREVLPRRTWFSRKAAGRGTDEQVIAANIDVVFIVFGLDSPVNPRAIERYLVVGRRSGAQPVVVLNKADLSQEGPAAVQVARAAAGDVPVVLVSTKTRMGLPDLEAFLSRGRTIALLGPSGAGKSTIVNRLIGEELLATGEVREWDARGRHTSVHRQLVVRAAGGLVIDTPGMRELQLWDTDAVSETFAEIDALSETCRFRDCRHVSEPGCAVKAAVDAGLLEAARYASFLKLQIEQEAIQKKRDERELAVTKRFAKGQGKPLKSHDKKREGE